MSRCFASVLLSVFLAGCGSSEEIRPELQPVSGTLTINGKPAVGATVILHPANGEDFDSRGSRPRGEVGPDGRFQVTTYQQGDGAPPGEYVVALLWFGKNGAGSSDWLAGAYARPEQGQLPITVKPGVDQLEPIEITGARIAATPAPRPGRDLDGLGQP